MAVYARMAAEYASRISRSEPDADLLAFMAALPPGTAPVLDWGCGPGNSTVLMQAEGIAVDATDASPQMAAIAADMGVAVRVEPFEALQAVDTYRGIWANFSLMHAPRSAVPGLIGQAARALLAGGVLHLGMKAGTGEGRDALGRYIGNWSEAELGSATAASGLRPLSARHGEGPSLYRHLEPFVIHLSRRPAG